MKRIIIIVFTLVLVYACKQPEPAYVKNNGGIFGTYFNIVYESPDGTDYHNEILSLLDSVNKSLSTFYKNSVLSKVNTNQEVELDSFFVTVFNRSLEISDLSGGAFDATVAPLVNAWGFGFTKKENVTPRLIDSLKIFTGYNKVRIANGKVVKDDPRLMLDFSAIAKGYGVDEVAAYLHKIGCKNYMVEIGGEVHARGVNSQGRTWRIGINEPNFDEPANPISLHAIVALKNKAVATSGNYRNYYEEGGKMFAHTIDPHTGYPVQHNLLSATVIANDCMTADALATAFMVLGVEKSVELAKKIDNIEYYLIYSGNDNSFETYFSAGFEKYLTE